MSKNRRADAHMRGAELDGDGKNRRSFPSTDFFSPLRGRNLGGQCEMRRRRLVDRRNAHQARKPAGRIFSRQLAMKPSASPGATPALLRFFAGIELNEKRGALAAGSDFLG